MKRIMQISVVFMLSLFTLTNCTQQIAVDVSNEIKARNELLVNSILNKDIDILEDLYTDDAVFLPPNSEAIKGKEAIIQAWEGFISMGLSDAKIITLEALSYGDIAIEEGRYEMYISDQKVDYGKYIVIWKKVDGVWKLHKDITNTSIPLPPPPAPEINEETESISE